MLRALGHFCSVMKGSSLLGKADKLELRERLPEARVALLEALDAVEDIQGEMLKAVASSVRLPVVTGLARIAPGGRARSGAGYLGGHKVRQQVAVSTLGDLQPVVGACRLSS